jgi:hypothetical protein
VAPNPLRPRSRPIQELDAHIVRLVPLLDDGDAVGCEAIPEGSNGVRALKVNPEVEEARQADRLSGRPESQGETFGVVEHQDIVVVAARGLRVEAEVRLVEATRALLIRDRKSQVLHAG